MIENLTFDFSGSRPKYPTAHRSQLDGRCICCAVCKLFFNQFGVPQRVWNKMTDCAKAAYQPQNAPR